MKRHLLACVLILISTFQGFTQSNNSIPPKGTVFNESEWLSDTITGRKLLRLTKNRDFNQQPTYHIYTAFSNDNRTMVFATWNANGESALVKADVLTGDLTVVATTKAGEPGRFNGNSICMLPAVNKAAATRGSRVFVYNLATLEEKLLMDGGQGVSFSPPAGTPDGKTVYVVKMPRYVQGTDDPYKAAFCTYYAIDVETGKSREVFRDSSRSQHAVVCPSNPDLLLIDRDLPPLYGSGGDEGKTSRVWLLNAKTGKLTEIRPKNQNRFQIHSNFSYKGDYIYYHGVSEKHTFKGGSKGHPHYIGVADLNGNILWEQIFPHFNYGHISSHTRRNSIITDALFMPDAITEIDWQHANTQGIPEIKILGAHNTGNHSYGQHTHPHCLMSPDGKFLSYNRGGQKHSDVYVLYIE